MEKNKVKKIFFLIICFLLVGNIIGCKNNEEVNFDLENYVAKKFRNIEKNFADKKTYEEILSEAINENKFYNDESEIIQNIENKYHFYVNMECELSHNNIKVLLKRNLIEKNENPKGSIKIYSDDNLLYTLEDYTFLANWFNQNYSLLNQGISFYETSNNCFIVLIEKYGNKYQKPTTLLFFDNTKSIPEFISKIDNSAFTTTINKNFINIQSDFFDLDKTIENDCEYQESDSSNIFVKDFDNDGIEDILFTKYLLRGNKKNYSLYSFLCLEKNENNNITLYPKATLLANNEEDLVLSNIVNLRLKDIEDTNKENLPANNEVVIENNFIKLFGIETD